MAESKGAPAPGFDVPRNGTIPGDELHEGVVVMDPNETDILLDAWQIQDTSSCP